VGLHLGAIVRGNGKSSNDASSGHPKIQSSRQFCGLN
jgi:hypothetical protein